MNNTAARTDDNNQSVRGRPANALKAENFKMNFTTIIKKSNGYTDTFCDISD